MMSLTAGELTHATSLAAGWVLRAAGSTRWKFDWRTSDQRRGGCHRTGRCSVMFCEKNTAFNELGMRMDWFVWWSWTGGSREINCHCSCHDGLDPFLERRPGQCGRFDRRIEGKRPPFSRSLSLDRGSKLTAGVGLRPSRRTPRAATSNNT
ncbi:hypothetical protein IWX90DRAFT_175587 [Phyllosticta citrichinensis]|uniref:Uncharacterized protein n=1 Tax=Phyllosticta citrichinensis TaxID=1130410 RepID=A0ABR1XVC6_9PEZI